MAVDKTNVVAKIIKAILAGAFIGLGGLGFILAKNAGFKFIPSLVFPVGLFSICMFGWDLYTGKIGFAIEKESGLGIWDLLLMLACNLFGAALIGLVGYAIVMNNESLLSTAQAVAAGKFGNFDGVAAGLILLKSFFCGIFVFLAVFWFKKSNTFVEKVLAVWIPIAMFVFLGLDHCIANMFYMFAGFEFTWQAIVAVLIAVVGNSLGAIVFNLAIKAIAPKEPKAE